MGNRISKLLTFAILTFVVSCASPPTAPPDAIVTSSPSIPGRVPNGYIPSQPKSLKFLMWPVTRHKVTQNFKPEGRKKKGHEGIDISSPKGANIYAPADGTVIYAGHAFHGYGRMIMIQHSPLFTTLYGHCQKLLVHSGEAVKRGSLIALVGRTGHATAPHLHFEVRVKKEPVDPLIYLED